jgi:nucleoside-diphosphate-sugar epimerase
VNLRKARSSEQIVLFASTGSSYGAVEGICTEETPLRPLSLYGETKMQAEECLLDAGNAIAFRLATGFGVAPRFRLDLMINDFVFQAVSNGYILLYEKDFRRTFIHVRDMARAFIHGLENVDAMRDEAYNVGSERMNYTKEDVALAVRTKVDYEIYYADHASDPDKRDYTVSYEKIRRTGFDTSITLEQGIAELVRASSVIEIHNPYGNTPR